MMSSGGGGGGNAGMYMQMGSTLLSAFGQHEAGSTAAANQAQAAADQAQNVANLKASQQESAKQMRESSDFQATQLRQNAGQEVAAAQRAAFDIGRQEEYIASRALAVAASSGAGASDPTVINLIARTAGESAYRRSVALYQGKEAERTLNTQADTVAYNGENAARNAVAPAPVPINPNYDTTGHSIGALTTLLKGGVSLYDKYGGGGPGTGATDALTTDNMSNGWF